MYQGPRDPWINELEKQRSRNPENRRPRTWGLRESETQKCIVSHGHRNPRTQGPRDRKTQILRDPETQEFRDS